MDTSLIMLITTGLLGTALYLKIGYAYFYYMENYDSEHSWLRRFFAGGWNKGKQAWSQQKTSFKPKEEALIIASMWVVLITFTIFSWVAWFIYKGLSFVLGRFIKK